jgi:hypothetical protein
LHFNASTYKSRESKEQETQTETQKEKEVTFLIVLYLVMWTNSWIQFQKKAEQLGKSIEDDTENL